MSKTDPFPSLLRAFFYEWLVEQRNASIHTVRSYRDTWRLYLRFVAQRAGKKVAVITLADLTASEVAAFLSHAEHDRGGTIGTRNCRLAAIRSFFHFVATKYPPSIAQCVEILNIPIKRAPVSEPCYLDPAEVTAILAQPDRSTIEGMRDHALLSFLYNSGARIQEALDLCPEAIRFESPSCVRLTGKGRKERICPLWPETVLLLSKLLERQPRAPDQSLGCPVQACRLREGCGRNHADAACQACDAARLPARHRRAPHLGGRRRHGHPQLARPCEPRHDQPLCEGQSGNETEGIGTGCRSDHTRRQAILEARYKRTRLARHALNNAKECWPETADISQSGRVPSHYRYLAITSIMLTSP